MDLEGARIAVCHEWAVTTGGSEKVAARLARTLRASAVLTFAADPRVARELFGSIPVYVHHWGLSAVARRHWPWLLPVMPFAWARADLRAYDVVVTSAHACANAIRVPPAILHISYCHTPMRYAWFWREEIRRFPRWLRPIWPLAAACFRAADRRWAARVNAFVANSHHVAGRIRTAYGRDATVVYPPIETDYWTPAPHTPTRSYFLFAGRLVPYKRPHVAVAAANVARVPLVVAGSGPELPRLRAIAGDTVRFVPAPDDTELRELYRHARALIHPGIEDFGMTLVEAQACGTPVIARDAGGAREAVVNGRTGILYAGETEQELADILASFDCERFSTPELRAHAEQFDSRIFDRRIRMVIRDALSTHSGLG